MAGGSSNMNMGDEEEVDLYGKPGRWIVTGQHALC